jgi:hypothetical protein
MKSTFKFLTALALVYSVVMLTACPSSASLQKAQESSARIAKYANAGVDLTRGLYESQVITLKQKDDIAKKFVLLAQGGIAFDAAVAKTQSLYGTNAPKNEVQAIFATFDTEVVGKFLDILQSLKVIANKQAYAAVIETIRTAVLVVAGVFGQQHAIAQRIEAAL